MRVESTYSSALSLSMYVCRLPAYMASRRTTSLVSITYRGTCPVSTEGWTRRVHFVREGGGVGVGRSRFSTSPDMSRYSPARRTRRSARCGNRKSHRSSAIRTRDWTRQRDKNTGLDATARGTRGVSVPKSLLSPLEPLSRAKGPSAQPRPTPPAFGGAEAAATARGCLRAGATAGRRDVSA